MVSIWPWAQPNPVTPPTVPTDTIIPVHYWDDTVLCRSAILYDLMRFDDVLDVGILKTSLEKLLDRKGWCKLGARVRLNKNGKLDYHIPAHFDENRPPFSFHHEKLELSINEHPLASSLPRASTSSSSTPQVVGNGGDFLGLMWRPGDPETLEDYLYSDLPMLGLRIISFLDATLMTISWSHIVLDGMGRKAFLDAWSLILHNREDEVLPLQGIDNDPLSTFGLQPVETYKHAPKQLSAFQMTIFGLRYLVDKLWNPQPKEESRIVFVPAAYARSLHESAMKDLSAAEDDVPFLSEGDILSTWWTRHLISAQLPSTSTRTIALNNVFNLRSLLGHDLLPSSHSYIGNAFCMIPVFIPAKEVLNKPLGLLAAAVRKSYGELGTREQVEALMGIQRGGNGSVMFGDGWMHVVVCTNWCKAELFEADFGGAVIDGVSGMATVKGEKAGGLRGRRGRPSFIHAHAFARGFGMINGFMVTGTDEAGNFWIHGVLRREVWEVVEKDLKEGGKDGGIKRC